MVKKDFMFRGKSTEELQQMDIASFAKLIPSRERRTLTKELPVQHKKFYDLIAKKDNVKTHCRDAVIIPMMINKKVQIYSGKTFEPILILPEMIGHRLGEFSQTRRGVTHNSPGIGATKSSAHVGVK